MMIFKRMLVGCLLTLAVAGLSAQSAKEEVDYMQSIFGMEKKLLVAEVVKPEEANKDAFWQLYDAYEVERKELGKKRLVLLESYSEAYEGLTTEKAAEFLKQSLALTKQNDKLLEVYVKKVAKAAGPVVAMQFHQIEMYILSEVRVAISASLPFPEAKK